MVSAIPLQVRCKHYGHRAPAHRGVVFFDDGWTDDVAVTSLPPIDDVSYYQQRSHKDRHESRYRTAALKHPAAASVRVHDGTSVRVHDGTSVRVQNGDDSNTVTRDTRGARVHLLEGRRNDSRTFTRHSNVEQNDVIAETTHGNEKKITYIPASQCM